MSEGEQLQPVTITTGASDGTLTEVLSGDVKEGDAVVTMVTLPGSTPAARPTASSNPLMGPTGPRR